MSEHEYDQYRVVGPNHHQGGQRVPEGEVLDAEDIPEGILRNFPTKFEPVEGDVEAESEDAEAEAEVEPVEDVDEDDPTTEEVPDSAAEGTDDTDLDAEEAIEDITAEPDVVVDAEGEVGEEYTREDLEAMSRNERVQIAKESDHPDIDGRSSDDDIIAALTDPDADADSDE